MFKFKINFLNTIFQGWNYKVTLSNVFTNRDKLIGILITNSSLNSNNN